MAKVWKPVVSVWTGGTAELLRLKDSRVRVARMCSGLLNDPGNLKHPRQLSLAPGRVGILTDARMLDIFVGFPNDANAQITTLNALLRIPGGIFGLRLNWPTFKSQFEIEIG